MGWTSSPNPKNDLRALHDRRLLQQSGNNSSVAVQNRLAQVNINEDDRDLQLEELLLRGEWSIVLAIIGRKHPDK